MSIFTRRGTEQIVDRGRVFCPVQRRDLDVEQCVDCSSLANVTGDARGVLTQIQCKPAFPLITGTVAR